MGVGLGCKAVKTPRGVRHTKGKQNEGKLNGG